VLGLGMRRVAKGRVEEALLVMDWTALRPAFLPSLLVRCVVALLMRGGESKQN